MTPFGCPVVPDVYINAAVSPGAGGSAPGASPEPEPMISGRYS